MEILPTTMVDGTMHLDGVILIASIGFKVNRYIATNFITLFYKYVKASRHAIPWPFMPMPTWSIVDCDVAGRWHQAEQSKSSTRCQNGRCYLPHRMPKIHRFPPPKSKAATPSPGRFSQNPSVLRLINMFSVLATGQSVRIRPPGRKMKAISSPPLQRISSIFPLENGAAAPPPDRPSPHPGARWFIVVYLRLVTG
jgi:hypothetical protein